MKILSLLKILTKMINLTWYFALGGAKNPVMQYFKIL